jgi:hypothetical protein
MLRGPQSRYGRREYCHVYVCDYRRGFGLEIRFIYHLEVVTTNNYNIIADFYTSHINAAHAKSFPARRVVAW